MHLGSTFPFRQPQTTPETTHIDGKEGKLVKQCWKIDCRYCNL